MRAAVLLLVTVLASAQTNRGAVEISGTAGVTIRPGAHGSLGGGIAVAAGPGLLIGVDLAFTRLRDDVLRAGSFPYLSAVSVRSSRAIDFTATVQVPLVRGRRVEPFLLGGGGVVRSWFTGSNSRFGQVYTGPYGDTGAVTVAGGGVRWFLGRRWGVRSDLRGFAPDPFMRASIGVFLQSR